MPSSEAIQRPRPVPIEWPSSWRVANCSASQVGAPGSQVGAPGYDKSRVIHQGQGFLGLGGYRVRVSTGV